MALLMIDCIFDEQILLEISHRKLIVGICKQMNQLNGKEVYIKVINNWME